MSKYHVPVMLTECLEGLQINPEGVYVDVTFGGGGHSRAIVEEIGGGQLYSFDQDADAYKNAEGIDESKFTLVQSNFRHIKRYLRMYGVNEVDGVLADLGVSSYQLDTAERGFSFMQDAELDMRMNRNVEKSAELVVNEYSAEDLQAVFGKYGEVKNAKTLAQTIVAARINERITTVFQFRDVIDKCAPRNREYKYYAQVFQALRIEVNDEIKALEELLEGAAEVLKPGGRFVVMSYHSLEDRLVKNFFQKGKFYGEAEKDFYGNVLKPLNVVTRKPVVASDEEIETNVRARSAKLRIATKA